MRVLILSFFFFLAGCAGLDSFVGYDHATGLVSPDATIAQVENVTRAFGPWGEIVAIGIGGLAAGYVAVRKIQKKVKDNKDKKAGII